MSTPGMMCCYKDVLQLPASYYLHCHLSLEAEWTQLQTYYFSENLVALGIEPGTSGSVARNSDI
jgi:hypothetical protein